MTPSIVSRSALLLLLALSGAAGSAENHAGIQVLDVRLGTHIDSQKRAPVPYSSFRPSEPKIVVSVHTLVKPGDETTATLGALWTFESDQGRQTVIDDSAELTFVGYGYTAFEISKQSPWPSGTYFLELFIEGRKVYEKTFSVL